MELMERAKAIILRPQETWQVIQSEEFTAAGLFSSYACILAIIPAVASSIGLCLIGVRLPFIGVVRQSVLSGIGYTILSYILSLAGILLTAYVADVLAPGFGSRRNFPAALKAVVFSYTPVWIVGILNIVPSLATVSWILSLYSLYLLFLGLPLLMETPADRKAGYVVVVVVVTLLVMIVISVIGGFFVAGAGAAGLRPAV